MKKIGIIGAMQIEVETLIERLEEKNTVVCAGMTFNEGKLCGVPAVVVRSGVGKVNAAACTQILHDRFGVDAIINTGVAGSLDADIDIGDLVVSTDVMHHDVDACVFGYAPGEVPQLGQVSFEADEEVAGMVIKACENASFKGRVHRGRVLSGDQFIVSREKKKEIAEKFGGKCTEMEGAAIAQTAWLNRIPFVVVRALSDKADESAKVDYPKFEQEAAEASVAMIHETMKILSASSS